MSLTLKDIDLWAELMTRIIRNKSTEAMIRRRGRVVAAQALIPEGHLHGSSLYRRLLALAKVLPDADALARQTLIDIAYQAARDLILNTEGTMTTCLEDLRLLLDRDGGIRPSRSQSAPKTHVAYASRLSHYSRRVDIFDRDDDAEETARAIDTRGAA